jgi:hypothetical protein
MVTALIMLAAFVNLGLVVDSSKKLELAPQKEAPRWIDLGSIGRKIALLLSAGLFFNEPQRVVRT